MMLDPRSIANYFLDLAAASGDALSPMKLQKLVYYAHGWYAGYTGKPLINESVEAWQYGPVIPSLYHEFKRFGAGSINSKATGFQGMKVVEIPPPADPEIRRFLGNVWTSYGRYTGVRLSDMTHASDGPWAIAWRKSGGVKHTDIPFDLISSHFRDAVERTKERSTNVENG